MGGSFKKITFNRNAYTRVYKNIVPSGSLTADCPYDLVYILKAQENNVDLKYSLRSICKFCTFRNIWFVGYKPSWTKNVNFIQTYQNEGKWKNSMINYLAACNCPDISENFILMNDDFFAIKRIDDWKQELNVCLGTLEEEHEKYKSIEKRSRWQYAFEYAIDLLDELNCTSHYNYETHLPIIINKQKFIEIMNLPELVAFQETPKVLHKRSVYKNLFNDNTEPARIIKDVKVELDKDLTDDFLQEKWLSVFDNVIGDIKRFPRMNQYLGAMFSNKCKFEV